MKANWIFSVAAVALMSGCSKKPEAVDLPDPTVGKSQTTIFYSGNLWGDLVECG